MKKFNQVIEIQVSVDNIAQQLLKTWNKADFPHAEMLTETIIGCALNSDTISLIYNNLNGYTNDIDFEVGQMVNCSQEYATYEDKGTEGAPKFERVFIPMGICEIVEIDTTKSKDKVKIEYTYCDSQGNLKENTIWVSHLKLTSAQQVMGD